jgi:teichuronic acid biosynthesis glycosyltransferase TuaH
MKILYLMHVDIKWIKQRPHFLAEEISKTNKLLLFYYFSYKRENLCSPNNKFNSYPYLLAPFFFKIYPIRALNSFLLKIFFKIVIIFYRPKYIWITSPFQYSFFFKKDKKKIIYDCMDYHREFFKGQTIRNEIDHLEKKIRFSVNKIICSSKNLSTRFNDKNTYIVNNAFSDEWRYILDKKKSLKSHKKSSIDNVILCYFGTLSNHINYTLLQAVTKKYKFITIRLIGPTEFVPEYVKLSKSIHIINSISHDKLVKIIEDVDIFFMPFVLNKLTISVDPVKLYEYILLGKPILSPYYSELDKFSKFVEFYKTEKDFMEILNKIIKSSFSVEHTKKEQQKFVSNNSWKNRCDQINKILKID